MTIRLSLAALAVTQALSFSAQANVIISEYVEGSSNNKAIELVNLGNEAVDLSKYSLEIYANGSTSALTPATSLSGQLAAKAVYVIAHTSAGDALKAKANSLAALNYNGDDALVLKSNGVVADSLGRVGERPNTSWNANGVSTVNMTIRRKASVTSGDLVIGDAFDPSVQYDAFAIDDFTDLGLYNGGGAEPKPYPHGNCGDAVTLISAVQGSGAATPLAGQKLTVEGVVTGNFPGSSGLGGFYLQQDSARYDQEPATSEAIFVSNSLNTEVRQGDVVRVSGVAEESFGQTQLAKLEAVTVCGTGVMPTAVSVQLPMASADGFEAVEGMLVRTSQNLIVTETFNLGRYNELMLSSKRLMTPTQVAAPGDEAKAVAAANALDKLTLDDGSNLQNIDTPYPAPGLTAENTVRSGDEVQAVTAIMGYGFSKYRLHPVAPVTVVAKNLRTAQPVFATPGDFHVASFNVLNYFNGDGKGAGYPTSRGATTAVEFDKQRAKTIAAISALNADIVGLLEIENDGFADTSAVADLVRGLNEKSAADVWAFVNFNTDKVGSDAITSAIIYRKDRMEEVGTAAFTTATPFDFGSRPPVAQTFRHKVSAESVQMVVTHLKSKGSCPSDRTDTANLDSGDGQGCWNAGRVLAAHVMSDWLATNPTKAVLASGETPADLRTLILGDINAYLKEDPIKALESNGYIELSNAIHGAEQYSYVFNGESGSLDHALANAALRDVVTDITEWHINADEPTILDYNEEFKSETARANYYAPTAYRSSDHDPVLISIRHTRPELAAQTFTVSENAKAGDLVGKLTAMSVRPVLNYSLSGELASWFSVNAEGEIRFTAAANPDFEAASQLTLQVVAEQQGGLTSPAVAVQVKLTNEAELPVLSITPITIAVPEDVAAGTSVASFTTATVGEGATLKSVTLSGAAGFVVQGDKIQVSNGVEVGVHKLTLKATDSLNVSNTASIDIAVTRNKDSGSMPWGLSLLLALVALRRRAKSN